MKKGFLLLLIGFASIMAYGQSSEVDKLVNAGIKLHDQGRYEAAIEKYKEALSIDKNSPFANYEIAFSYMALKDYKNAAKFSKKVLDAEPRYSLHAYIVYGSSLDELGKPDDAVKAYEKGISQFGNHYLLHYNLGLTQYRQNRLEKAEEALVNAVANNPKHGSSHFLLGLLMYDMKYKVRSLLALHHFLLIEPNSDRSKTAYNLLADIMGANVKSDNGEPNKYTISLNLNPGVADGFRTVEVMLSLLSVSKTLEVNANKTANELFIENTQSVYSTINEVADKEKLPTTWWEYYVPQLTKLAKSEHLETFCYYIRQAGDKEAKAWVKANPEKVDLLETWILNNIR